MPTAPLSDLALPTGLHYRVLEPRRAYELAYRDPDGGDLAIDLTFRAVMDPLHTKTSGPDGGHFDQLGHFTGTVVLDGETIAVDSFGARDRSWGPRSQTGRYLMDTHGWSATEMPYSHATSTTASFQAITANVTDEYPVVMGFLLDDGEVARLERGRRAILERDPVTGTATRVLVEGTDELGRELRAEGECVSRFLNSCNENLVGWNHLVRWDVNGNEAWGEQHENFSMPALRAAMREQAGWD